MDVRLAWTDRDEAGDYVVPTVLLISPKDLVSRPDNLDETVPHTRIDRYNVVPRGSESDV